MKCAIVVGAAILALCSGSLNAQQGYPNKVVRMVVPTTAGSGPDIVARILAAKLAEALGQQVVVDNRAGAGGTVGAGIAARAAPDGYTLLIAGGALTINPIMYRKLPYDAVNDFAPISQIVSLPFILVVHPSLPATTVPQLIALAKSRPNQLNYASAGIGGGPHMAMELFLGMTHTTMTHVPYKGASSGVIDMLAGQVTVMMPNVLTVVPYVKGGRLRALGVTGANRTVALPEIPPIAEAGVPGYEAVQWYGVFAPASTPKEIISRLNSEIVRIVKLAEVKDRLAGDGADPVGGSPGELAAFLKSEISKWAKVARDSGLKPE